MCVRRVNSMCAGSRIASLGKDSEDTVLPPEPADDRSRDKFPGLMRIVRATGYSLAGLKAAFRLEPAFRQELAFAVVLIPLAFVVGRTLVETALLIVTLVIVFIVELINSAIEAIVDRIGSEHNELSGRAKDIGSAAVMLALVLVVTVWSLVLLSRAGY